MILAIVRRTGEARMIALAAGLVTALALAFLSLQALPAKAQDFRVSTITVQGNSGIESAAVIGFSQLVPGQSYSAAELNAALQRLQETGLFETVELVPSGGRLTIRVAEHPLISRISVEGNRILSDEQVLEIIETRARRVFNPAQVEAGTNALVQAYRDLGHFGAEVVPRIIRRPSNRVDLVFEVFEGRTVEIERVSFVGNRAFSDGRLRRVLESKQAGLFRLFVQRDNLVEGRIELDKAMLRDFYLSRGYADIQILSVTTEYSRERNAFFLTVNLREGQKFSFGKITTVSEIPGVSAEEFDRLARIRTGRTYSPVQVDNVVSRMEALGLRKGLNLLRVDPRVTRNARERTLDIEFALVEGPRIFVERIDIEGNKTTLDRVIRRQFRIAEGDVFNPREIREAAQRIRAMGLFQSTEVQTSAGSAPDQLNIDVTVEEALTGSLSFGAAYNLSTGFGGTVTYRERNFLGRGQTLNLDLKAGADNANFGLNFIEPAFLGRDLSFRFDAEYQQTEFGYTDYDTQSWLLRPGFTLPVAERGRVGVRATVAGDRIFNVDSDSSSILQAEEAAGPQATFGPGYTLSYDTRSTGVNPNAGILLRFGQDLRFSEGASQSIKTTALALAEAKILNEEVTLRATWEGGVLNSFGQPSRLNDRFFLTSSRMRGFAPAGVGPRDLTAPNRDALGGNLFSALRFETEFPLGLPEELGVSGGLFLDYGSVWGLDDTAGGAVDDGFHLRSSAGASIFWTTPLGPLRFNFSEVLQKQSYDKAQAFELTLSTNF